MAKQNLVGDIKLTHLAPGSIKVSDRFRKDFGDIGGLAESIREDGLLQLPLVDPRGRLIAGERRLRAMKSLGEKLIPCLMMDVKDPVRAQIVENLDRKDFSAAEKLKIVARMTREMNGTRRGEWERIARAVGWSPNTVRKAHKIQEVARKDPVRFKKFERRVKKTGRVDGAFKAMKKTFRQVHDVRPTFKGVVFRTETEARWAAVFELAKVQWKYETPRGADWKPSFRISPGGRPRQVEIVDYADFELLFHGLDRIERAKPVGEVWKLGGRIFSVWPPDDKAAKARVVGLVRAFSLTAKAGSWAPLVMPPQWADYWSEAARKVEWKTGAKKA